MLRANLGSLFWCKAFGTPMITLVDRFLPIFLHPSFEKRDRSQTLVTSSTSDQSPSTTICDSASHHADAAAAHSNGTVFGLNVVEYLNVRRVYL
jgi:hypothetical protein